MLTKECCQSTWFVRGRSASPREARMAQQIRPASKPILGRKVVPQAPMRGAHAEVPSRSVAPVLVQIRCPSTHPSLSRGTEASGWPSRRTSARSPSDRTSKSWPPALPQTIRPDGPNICQSLETRPGWRLHTSAHPGPKHDAPLHACAHRHIACGRAPVRPHSCLWIQGPTAASVSAIPTLAGPGQNKPSWSRLTRIQSTLAEFGQVEFAASLPKFGPHWPNSVTF